MHCEAVRFSETSVIFTLRHGITEDLIGQNKGKGKVASAHASKPYRRSRGIAPFILNLGTVNVRNRLLDPVRCKHRYRHSLSYWLRYKTHHQYRDPIHFGLRPTHTYIQGVSIPVSQTFPGYSSPPNKQKSSYQHGSKNQKVPRYRLTFMCWYPFECHIRCSKCWPFAATHPLRRRIMDSLTRSSWPGLFLMASNVATFP